MLHHLLLLILPLLFANTVHMLVVKKNWLPMLAVPVQQQWFGKNKTCRGFLLLPLLSGMGMAMLPAAATDILHSSPFVAGVALGWSYLLAELPNSYLKRRLGIAPGEAATTHAWLFHLLDKTDSALGVSLMYMLLADIELQQSLLLLLIGSGTHMLVSLVLVKIKLKRSY